jgi:hypothetical protein
LFLPVALTILISLITILLISVVPPVAGWIFYVELTIAIAVVHGYLYMLYRELMNDPVKQS